MMYISALATSQFCGLEQTAYFLMQRGNKIASGLETLFSSVCLVRTEPWIPSQYHRLDVMNYAHSPITQEVKWIRSLRASLAAVSLRPACDTGDSVSKSTHLRAVRSKS